MGGERIGDDLHPFGRRAPANDHVTQVAAWHDDAVNPADFAGTLGLDQPHAPTVPPGLERVDVLIGWYPPFVNGAFPGQVAHNLEYARDAASPDERQSEAVGEHKVGMAHLAPRGAGIVCHPHRQQAAGNTSQGIGIITAITGRPTTKGQHTHVVPPCLEFGQQPVQIGRRAARFWVENA